MMRKVYLHARYELKPGDPEPDFRSLFSVMEARRMAVCSSGRSGRHPRP